MSYTNGALRAMWVTLRNMFRRPITEGLRPHERRAERYRASFALVPNEHGEEACIGCRLCLRHGHSRLREAPVRHLAGAGCGDLAGGRILELITKCESLTLSQNGDIHFVSIFF